MSNPEHLNSLEELTKDSKDIKEVFHKLWTKDTGTEGYKKSDWIKLRDLMNYPRTKDPWVSEFKALLTLRFIFRSFLTVRLKMFLAALMSALAL